MIDLEGGTVLHIVPDLRRQAGGIASTVSALAEALCAQNIESKFLTLNYDQDFAWRHQTICASAEAARCPARLEKLTTKVLTDLPPRTVVHSHGIWAMLNHSALRAAATAGMPCLVSVHGMLLSWARHHKKIRKDLAWVFYQRRDLRRADGIHVTSTEEARVVAETTGANAVTKIPFGVELPEVAPSLCRSRKTLLFLGRLHPVKNLEALIYAFNDAAPEDWNLRLAGPDEGNHRSTLETLVANLDAASRISFSGPIYGRDKDLELASARALVLPSFTENFGAVVAEALAMGRPVIASNATPWQALERENCGWWVPPDRVSLARAIAQLSQTPPKMLAEMGKRGRSLVTREYSWERVGTDMAQLYLGLANR